MCLVFQCILGVVQLVHSEVGSVMQSNAGEVMMIRGLHKNTLYLNKNANAGESVREMIIPPEIPSFLWAMGACS